MNYNKKFILDFLVENKNNYVTSKVICEKLKLTRAGVSKHIKSLVNDGYVIKSKSNVGYKLVYSDVINKSSIFNFIKDDYKSITIDVLDSVDSTNNVAKRKTFFKNERYYLVVSREQTSGRGRMGRSFFSPKDKGIYMTLSVKLNKPIEKMTKITTATSLFVLDSIKNIAGIGCKIKWINDLYYNDKKICGILTESINDVETGIVHVLIIGIGINIDNNLEDIPDDLKNKMGALFNNSVYGDFDKNKLISNIVNLILDNIFSIDELNYIERYKENSMVIGKNIKYILNGQEYKGQVFDIDENGSLIVKNDNESTKTLSSGEISIII